MQVHRVNSALLSLLEFCWCVWSVIPQWASLMTHESQCAFSTPASFLPLFKDVIEELKASIIQWVFILFRLSIFNGFSPVHNEFKCLILQRSPRFLPCLILCMLMEVFLNMLPSDVEILPSRSLFSLHGGDVCHLELFASICQETVGRPPEGHDFNF